jgi:hypothetical protein
MRKRKGLKEVVPGYENVSSLSVPLILIIRILTSLIVLRQAVNIFFANRLGFKSNWVGILCL